MASSTATNRAGIAETELLREVHNLHETISKASLKCSPSDGKLWADLRKHGDSVLQGRDTKDWNRLIDGAQACTDGFLDSDK